MAMQSGKARPTRKVTTPVDTGRPGEHPALNRDLANPTANPIVSPHGSPPAPNDPISNSDCGANDRAGGY